MRLPREEEKGSGPHAPRGFAAMEPQQRREIARRGGRVAQESRSPEERREISRRGGHAAQEERTPERRTEIGRRGAQARWQSKKTEESLRHGEYRRGGSHPMGFAAMDPRRQREIARRGGRSVPRELREGIGRRGSEARWGHPPSEEKAP